MRPFGATILQRRRRSDEVGLTLIQPLNQRPDSGPGDVEGVAAEAHGDLARAGGPHLLEPTGGVGGSEAGGMDAVALAWTRHLRSGTALRTCSRRVRLASQTGRGDTSARCHKQSFMGLEKIAHMYHGQHYSRY